MEEVPIFETVDKCSKSEEIRKEQFKELSMMNAEINAELERMKVLDVSKKTVDNPPLNDLPDGFIECDESEATHAWTGRVMLEKHTGNSWIENEFHNVYHRVEALGLKPTFCKKKVKLPAGWREAKPGEAGIMVVREDGK